MTARDELLDEYGRAVTAPLGTLLELKQKLDEIRAEARVEAAEWFASYPLSHGNTGWARGRNDALAWVVSVLRIPHPQRPEAAAPVDHAAVPLVVSRFDVAMEPAPEEEQVLVIGCIAEDGRPVALLLDPDDRRKVAGWLAPTVTEWGVRLTERGRYVAGKPTEQAAREDAADMRDDGVDAVVVSRTACYGEWAEAAS